MAQAMAVAVIGIALFLFGLHQRRKLRASRDWQRALGNITNTRIDTIDRHGQETDERSFEPIVEYSFWANGQTFYGRRMGFSTTTYPSVKKAQAALAPYNVGAPIEVFYDPANPQECVLERKDSVGLVFIILGAGMILLAVAAIFRR
jgi:hypothetical protein